MNTGLIEMVRRSYELSLRDMEFDDKVHRAEMRLVDDIISARWDLIPLNSERDQQRGERRLYKSALNFAIWTALNS